MLQRYQDTDEGVPLAATVLTSEGWRSWEQLAVGQDILAYDVQTDRCRWATVTSIAISNQPQDTLRFSSRSFELTCTHGQPFAVIKGGRRIHSPQRAIKAARDLKKSDEIILAARAESGQAALSAREAALIGWIATDGTIRTQRVRYAGRIYGPYRRIIIAQSKPSYLEELRNLVGPDGTEQVSGPRRRDFGAYTSECLPLHKFELNSEFAKEMLSRAGFVSFVDLPRLVTDLTHDARLAMLDAMLKGDGTLRRGNSWVFGQKAKPGVTEAFEILATLCGVALGKPRTSTVGEVPVRQLRRNSVVQCAYLTREPGASQRVWLPRTQLRTLVMNLDGVVSIMGGPVE